jgi:YbbR domain-containing protein
MTVRLSENLSYKFVALGVAFILWTSLLGRKDSTLVKDFELQLLLNPNVEMVSQVPQTIRVEVAGPRVALKKLNQITPLYTVDLTSARPGRQVVQLSRDGVNVPIGARVLSIEPREFVVQIRANSQEEKK